MNEPALHLVDRDSPPLAAAVASRLYANATDGSSTVLALGDGPHVDWLARSNVPFEIVPLRGRSEPFRSLALGRRLSDLLATASPAAPTTIFAHSPRAAVCATVAGLIRRLGRKCCLRVEVYCQPQPRALAWLIRCCRWFDLRLVAHSQTLARLAIDAGFPPDRVDYAPPAISPGAIDSSEPVALYVRSVPVRAVGSVPVRALAGHATPHGVTTNTPVPSLRLPRNPLDSNRRAAVRAALNLPGDVGPVLLAGGWGLRRDRQELALWAAAILSMLDPKLRILVPGDTSRCDELARWIGHAGYGQIAVWPARRFDWPDLLAAADVFIHAGAVGAARPGHATGSARLEADPMPMWWAMLAGRPIVAMDGPGPRELLVDGRTALLCPTDRPRDLALRVRQVLIDKPLADRLTAQARQEALARLTENQPSAAGFHL